MLQALNPLNMHKMKYTYSQLSSPSAGHIVASHYDFPKLISCKFYVLGLHDNYLIEADDKKYILRVYRNDWRTAQEIQFELELLDFLREKNMLVGFPIPTKAGELSFSIESPEGNRIAALFSYADGAAPGNGMSIEESTLLGKAVARVHQITDSFETNYTRKDLDIPYLLDESILTIQPYLDVDAFKYMQTLQKNLKEAQPSLPQKPGVYGICIGDVNPSNFHINDGQEITLFDFDQCGYGYRAFEIGKFISSIPSTKKNDISKAFVDGYQQVRPLTQKEHMAIPYYELLSVIWVMAIHASNADRIGHKYLAKPFWDRRLALLKDLYS